MKRRKGKKQFRKADAILTGDWHLRENNPVCRTDNFVEEKQWEKLQFISDLQKKHDCIVLHSGDLFDNWKPSPWLLSKAIQYIPDNFCTVYGNHDLPQHNLELADKCGIYLLEKAKKLTVLHGTHWGQSIQSDMELRDFATLQDIDSSILVWHTMTYQGKEPWPGCTDPNSKRILTKHKGYDLILTGHNHKPFVEELNGRLLVNPGSIFRMTADQIEHTPRVYLYYADANTVEPVYLPIEDGVMSREHIDAKEDRSGRIDAFIETLQGNYKSGRSFVENIEAFKSANDIETPVMDIVYKSIN